MDWPSLFSFSLLVLFGLRIVAMYLPKLYTFLLNNLHPGVRAENVRLRLLSTQLQQMQSDLSNVSQTDEFAKYSKLKRKINAIQRELSESRSKKNIKSIKTSIAWTVTIFMSKIFAGLMFIYYTPAEHPLAFWKDLPYLLIPLLYLPGRIYMTLWLALCGICIDKFFKALAERTSESDAAHLRRHLFEFNSTMASSHMSHESVD